MATKYGIASGSINDNLLKVDVYFEDATTTTIHEYPEKGVCILKYKVQYLFFKNQNFIFQWDSIFSSNPLLFFIVLGVLFAIIDIILYTCFYICKGDKYFESYHEVRNAVFISLLLVFIA